MDPDRSRAPVGPRVLAALATLLERTHLAPPDALPDAVDAALDQLGATGTLYLADYAGTTLVPMTRPGAERPPNLPLDSTLAGLAFRMTTATPGPSGDAPVLWMPVIDGVERLGVLKIELRHAADLDDEPFRRDCWLVVHLLGHLVSVMDAFGDGIDTARRDAPRTVAAELIWQLLPPLTAGTDKVVITGRLEPSGAVGGDAFDYALSDDEAQFTILDATGHDVRSGLAASTALAACRNARRQGHGLFAQTEAIHRAVMDEFAGDMFVTGVLGQLHLPSGRLRYLAAGHPPPLLLRRGRVVKRLTSGKRPLLGLEMQHATVAEETLEPDDVVVLYTDGIIEARDHEHQQFGIDRLVDFLEREATDGTPLPEVVRRVCRRILDHQGGELQDDATVLLVQWTSRGQALLDPLR